MAIVNRGMLVGHVFISYKREDKGRVAPLVEVLRAGGIETWWDQDIPPGGAWRDTIVEKLDSAALAVVIWSEHSVGTPGRFVREEAERAARRTAYLGVLIDDVPPPFGFSEWQAIDLSGWRGKADDPGLNHLVETVRARLSGAPLPVAPVAAPARRGTKARGKALLAALAVAVLAAGGGAVWWWSAGQGSSAATPTVFVNGELERLDCTWAQISAVPPSETGVSVQLSGIASSPPLVRELLLQRAQAQGVPLTEVDVAGLAQTPQAVCPQINAMRPFRVANSDRFQVVPERGSVQRSGGQLTGLVEVELDLAQLPPHVALLGLDDESGLEVLIPDVRRHPHRGGDQNHPVLDLVFEDEGRNVRNVALILVTAPQPFAAGALPPEGRPDEAADLQRLEAAARAGGWRFELGIVRCGFDVRAGQRC